MQKLIELMTSLNQKRDVFYQITKDRENNYTISVWKLGYQTAWYAVNPDIEQAVNELMPKLIQDKVIS